MEASLEARKQTAFRILNDVFNEGTDLIIDEVCAKNIVVHVSEDAVDINGIKAFKDYIKDFLHAFTDIHLDVNNLHAEGDMVDVHASFVGTNIAPFRGVPAKRGDVATEPVFFFKFGHDGKIVEYWQESIL
jgi:predicted ester cyclase